MDRDALIQLFDKEAERRDLGVRLVDALIAYDPEVTQEDWGRYKMPAIQTLGWAWSAVLADEIMLDSLRRFRPGPQENRLPRDPSMYTYCVWKRMGCHRDDRLLDICRFPHQVGFAMARDLLEADHDHEYTVAELITLFDDHWYEYSFSIEFME